jgi:hypothetical protein
VNYRFELTPALIILAVPILLIVPAFAMIAVLLIALVAAAAVVALCAAIIATPYRLGRRIHRRYTARHRSTEHSAPVAGVVARAPRPLPRSRVAILASTTARRAS